MLTVSEIKARIAPIAEKHGINRVGLFGSYARGEATENSDIDLILDVPSGATLFSISDFLLDGEDALHKTLDYVLESEVRNAPHKEFRNNVNRDRISVYP